MPGLFFSRLPPYTIAPPRCWLCFRFFSARARGGFRQPSCHDALCDASVVISWPLLRFLRSRRLCIDSSRTTPGLFRSLWLFLHRWLFGTVASPALSLAEDSYISGRRVRLRYTRLFAGGSPGPRRLPPRSNQETIRQRANWRHGSTAKAPFSSDFPSCLHLPLT